MDIAPIITDAAMTALVRQMETGTAIQMAVLKSMAEGQQEMAEMLHVLGVGQNLDTRV